MVKNTRNTLALTQICTTSTYHHRWHLYVRWSAPVSRAKPDPKVGEALAREALRVVEVATIENHRLLQRSPESGKVRTTKWPPFGGDDKGIRITHRLLHAVTENEIRTVTVDAPGFPHRARVVRLEPRPRGPEILQDGAARRLAHIVRVWLER